MQVTCVIDTMRTHQYKEKIIELLQKSHLLTIGEIHKSLPQADYSTVYRNIEQLLTNKKIKKIIIDNKSTLYELAHGNDHDHFVCNDCGTVDEIEIPRDTLDISMPVTDIVVRGTCNDCKEVCD
jgi:Fe2+ or Zn2+ uptake regulation protein